MPCLLVQSHQIYSIMSLDVLVRSGSKAAGSSGAPPAKRRSWTWLLPVLLIAGFLLILFLIFGERLWPAIPVKTAKVITLRTEAPGLPGAQAAGGELRASTARGDLLFQASGWLEPDPFPIFVPVLTDGVIEELHVLEGQKVRAGELLATLVDDDARLDVREAERKYLALEKKIEAHCVGFDVLKAQITAARRKVDANRALLNEARDHLERLNQLSTGAVSRQKVVQASLAEERQQALLAEAEAEIPRLEAELIKLESEKESMLAGLDELKTVKERADLFLDRTRITAPMDGIVLHLHAAPGMKRILKADSPKSAVIVELYHPRKLQARIDVPLNEAASLRPGLPVEVVSEILPDSVFSGTVTRVTGQADLQRNTLQAKVQIDDPDDRLRPEMLVRAKFYAPVASGADGSTVGSSGGRLSLFVPEEALESETEVWVVTPESRAEKRRIKLSDDVRDGYRRLLEGLRSNETLILPPHDSLEEGARVKVVTPE